MEPQKFNNVEVAYDLLLESGNFIDALKLLIDIFNERSEINQELFIELTEKVPRVGDWFIGKSWKTIRAGRILNVFDDLIEMERINASGAHIKWKYWATSFPPYSGRSILRWATKEQKIAGEKALKEHYEQKGRKFS